MTIVLEGGTVTGTADRKTIGGSLHGTDLGVDEVEGMTTEVQGGIVIRHQGATHPDVIHHGATLVSHRRIGRAKDRRNPSHDLVLGHDPVPLLRTKDLRNPGQDLAPGHDPVLPLRTLLG